MGRTIKRIKTISFIIILLEILAGSVFSVVYFNNYFHVQNIVTPYIITLASIAVLVVNCLLIWIIILILSSLRQKTDLRAAEVIGSDVQEAYNFAMIGLAITDDKNVVLWTNDLFKSRHIEIMDTDIIAWKPELAT